jgi:FKBP-type peptidyl-prolyl cis-trans isomerase FklB
MKKLTTISLALAVFAGLANAQEKLNFADAKVKGSYSIGADIANNFKRQGIEIDPKALAAGLMETYAGKSALTEAEMKEAMTKFREELMAKMQAKQKTDGDKNLKEGEEFLAANAKKEGVKVLPSGLQYKVIKSGNGKTPKATDTVKTHYHGTLIDGTVFDSSVERKEPISFAVNGVIAGWTEALQLMKEGDKWQLFVPSKLAYRDQQMGPKIAPNSTLIFEVELLAIEPPK